jgi:TusA-related sulfurtransferase
LKTIDIKKLGFDQGAHLLLKQALKKIEVGSSVVVLGDKSDLNSQVRAWCRLKGFDSEDVSIDGRSGAKVTKKPESESRWTNAFYTGSSFAEKKDGVLDQASSSWGLAARGAIVEAGVPQMHFSLNKKNEIWSENLKELYHQAVNAQWNQNTDIDWDLPFENSEEIEQAIVQVFTYMVENEQAAMIIPTRFLGQVHPHYTETQQLMAIQIADEARHIDTFNRRIALKNNEPARSTSGGQESLKSLIDQKDFSVSELLLSVLGEGTFVNLLNFLQEFAPDPVTKQIAALAARDESRHVAFGMVHLLNRLKAEPEFRSTLENAIEGRSESLSGTTGLNEDVFDSLLIIGAGAVDAEKIPQGFSRVQELMLKMQEGRTTRLIRLGFDKKKAEYLASLHTKNFM